MSPRYKPDNVLIADTLANASRFAAVAARKLTRDGKFESGGCIEIHALLQVWLCKTEHRNAHGFCQQSGLAAPLARHAGLYACSCELHPLLYGSSQRCCCNPHDSDLTDDKPSAMTLIDVYIAQSCTGAHIAGMTVQMVLNAAKAQHAEVFVVLGDLISVCAVSCQSPTAYQAFPTGNNGFCNDFCLIVTLMRSPAMCLTTTLLDQTNSHLSTLQNLVSVSSLGFLFAVASDL